MSDNAPLWVSFDEFELDEANARLRSRTEVLALPPRAFSVLCELARRPGQLVTKDALLDAVWGHRHVSESVLKSTISQLRATLNDDAKVPRFIETASRRGYRFIAGIQANAPSVTRTTDATPPCTASGLAEDAMPAGSLLTGRGAALSRLHAAWDRARDGQRQLCWVSGEAGVGKTTLINHFAASLDEALVARGQCVEQHGTGEPYLPVLEALAALCRDDPELPVLLRAVAPTWLLQLPWLCSESERESLRRELAGTTQDRMLREFGELLDRYTQQRPVLLIAEDLHWSDHATVGLLNHVARRRGAARWMWLATFRVTEVIAEDHPLKALRNELHLHRLSEEIAIEPFSELELAEYVARRLRGATWPDLTLQALHLRTDGLPLFVANVIDDLATQDAVGNGASLLEPLAFEALPIPESLTGVMERRIQRLPADQTTLLEAASACGVDFRPSVVAEVLGRSLDWVSGECEVLTRQRQWLTRTQVERGANGELEGRYAFRHALVRHVFLDRMGPLTRARLHHKIGLALVHVEASGGTVSAVEIATHFELGHDPDAALPYVATAAASALQQFAPMDAMRLADHGLELVPRCEPGGASQQLLGTLHTLRGASAAQLLGVGAQKTLQSFEAAHSVLDAWPLHSLRSLALHGLGLGWFLSSGPAKARELAQRSLTQARQRDDAVMIVAACDLLGQVIKLEGPSGEAIAVLEEGIRIAQGLDEHTLQSAFVLDPLVNMRAALAIPLLLAGFDVRSRTQSELALARAQALRQPMARMIATWLAILCDLRRGARDEVVAMAAELRTITDEGSLAQSEGPSEWFRGLSQAWSGAPEKGHATILDAHKRNEQVGMLYGASEVLGYATEALILAGDWGGAARQVDEALELAERLHDHSYRPQLWLLKRRVALAAGSKRDADIAAHQALMEARRQGALWLEAAVLVDVCESAQATPHDLAALRAVVALMPESSSAPIMVRARELL